MPINLILNDKPILLEDALSLEQAITKWNLVPNTFAIAINNVFVSKHQYATTTLQQNDRIEIVTAMQGG